MAIDVSRFHPHNIADTCAVWNILSSRRLLRVALDAGVVFVCTRVVAYECLLKPRKNVTDADVELRSRLQAAQEAQAFSVFSLDIDDLQTVELLEKRKRLGKGELSSIAFALKTRQAFLTDDQKARKLAADVLSNPGAQTTPHLFGWLYFNNHLTDSEKDSVIAEHKQLARPLATFFEQIYLEALRCRLMAAQKVTTNV
jgi:hypothetical protein